MSKEIIQKLLQKHIGCAVFNGFEDVKEYLTSDHEQCGFPNRYYHINAHITRFIKPRGKNVEDLLDHLIDAPDGSYVRWDAKDVDQPSLVNKEILKYKGRWYLLVRHVCPGTDPKLYLAVSMNLFEEARHCDLEPDDVIIYLDSYYNEEDYQMRSMQ